MTYQRKGNDNTSIENIPQGNPSQKAKVSSNIDLNIDLRDGCRMKKQARPVSKLIKIPSQKDNLLLFIEGLKERIVEKIKEVGEDVSMILQAM